MKAMNQKLAGLVLMLGLFTCGCTDTAEISGEDLQRLDTVEDIAVEIQQSHNIESHPYYRIAEDAGQIELHISDPGLDHQSLATETSKLKSVQSFDRKSPLWAYALCPEG